MQSAWRLLLAASLSQLAMFQLGRHAADAQLQLRRSRLKSLPNLSLSTFLPVNQHALFPYD
jgi:hypothetical protein